MGEISPGPGDGREYTWSKPRARAGDEAEGSETRPCSLWVCEDSCFLQFSFKMLLMYHVCYVTCVCMYSTPLLHWRKTTSSWVCRTWSSGLALADTHRVWGQEVGWVPASFPLVPADGTPPAAGSGRGVPTAM